MEVSKKLLYEAFMLWERDIRTNDNYAYPQEADIPIEQHVIKNTERFLHYLQEAQYV